MEGKEKCNQFVHNLVPMHIKNFVSIRRCAQLSLRTQFTASQQNRVTANIGANCSQRSKQRNADDGKHREREGPIVSSFVFYSFPHTVFSCFQLSHFINITINTILLTKQRFLSINYCYCQHLTSLASQTMQHNSAYSAVFPRGHFRSFGVCHVRTKS